jgi:hypothetical protein
MRKFFFPILERPNRKSRPIPENGPVTNSSFFRYRREPGTGTFGPGAALEDRRPDVIDGPPVPEALLYLFLCYSPRTVSAGLQVGKAEHEVFPGRRQDGGKVIHEDGTVFI